MAVGLKIVNGDFIINPSGNIEMAQQNEKCSRDFGKMLLTAKENADNTTTYERYNPDYGTDIDNKSLYVGQSRMGKRDTVIMILNASISSYLKLQESRDNLDFGEVITNIDFDVFYDVRDLRNLVIDIRFETAYGGETISLGQFVQNVE
jgi:hypothetical protein